VKATRKFAVIFPFAVFPGLKTPEQQQALGETLVG